MTNIETSKNRFNAIYDKIKVAFKRFPFTMITIAFTTLFISIFLDTDFFDNDTFENIVYFCIFFGIGSFFIEAFLIKNRKLKIFLLTANCIVSAVFVKLINTRLDDNAEFLLNRVIPCYIVLMLVSGIYILYKRSGKSIEQYLLEVSSGAFKISLIYFVLSIGIAIITSIFIYLIAGNNKLIFRLEIILFGLYYLPTIIYNFTNSENEVGVFFKKLIKYVFGPLVFVAFIIIYIYMIKIFALMKIPSNQIFRILSVLFVFGLPIWTMIHSFNEEKSLWQKIFNKMPIAFIPFIFLEAYSLITRINANGITPTRYVGIIIIVFQIIYIAFYIFKKQKINYIILVFEVLLVIAILVPGINMYTVSNLNQANRLKVYTKKQELTEKEKSNIYSAYRYLKNSQNGEKYINKILTNEDIEKIKTFSGTQYDYESYNNGETVYIYNYLNIEVINIKGYSKLYPVSLNDYDNINGVNLKKAKVQFENSSGNMEIDLYDEINNYIDQYLNNEKYFSEYFKNNNIIMIDDNTSLILYKINISYNESKKQVKNYSISGYLLEK